MYQRGKVYAIICRKTDRRYIGSTCEPTIAKRLAKHVSDFKNWKEGKSRYVMSYDIIKDGDYHIVLLELYPCNSRDELRMCEQKHIDACECLNKQKAFRSEEEKKEYNKQFYKQHKEELAEKMKEYREKHKEELIEKAKIFRKENKEKLAEIQKIKYEKNKKQYTEKMKEYRKTHKEQIDANKKKRICCPTCQKEMNKDSLYGHKKICV